MALITYRQRYMSDLPSLNYGPHCVPSSQTASCAERSARQPINRLIMADLPKKRLAYQSPPLPKPGLITLATSTSPFVNLPRIGGHLLTYLSARADHVEVVPSMYTSSCVLGIERIVSHRSTQYTCYDLVRQWYEVYWIKQELHDCIEKISTLNISAEFAQRNLRKSR